MQWLQSTFATRFNRFWQESGHVFQDRYKAILVESVEYWLRLHTTSISIRSERRSWRSTTWARIHLAVTIGSSGEAPRWLSLALALEEAGGLKDTRSGRDSYRAYLGFLSDSDEEQRRLQFEKLCTGWLLGSRKLEDEIAAQEREKLLSPLHARAETREGRELLWENALAKSLDRLRRSREEASNDRKSAD